MKTKVAALTAEQVPADALGTAFSALASGLRKRWVSWRAAAAIADLDDRTLEDIGLDRTYARRPRGGMVDWVVQSHSGTARLVFIGR